MTRVKKSIHVKETFTWYSHFAKELCQRSDWLWYFDSNIGIFAILHDIPDVLWGRLEASYEFLYKKVETLLTTVCIWESYDTVKRTCAKFLKEHLKQLLLAITKRSKKVLQVDVKQNWERNWLITLFSLPFEKLWNSQRVLKLKVSNDVLSKPWTRLHVSTFTFFFVGSTTSKFENSLVLQSSCEHVHVYVYGKKWKVTAPHLPFIISLQYVWWTRKSNAGRQKIDKAGTLVLPKKSFLCLSVKSFHSEN